MPPPDRLAPAPWMQAPATLAVIAALRAEGGEEAARYVGGCVRDTLLGLPAALAAQDEGGAALDVDIATSLAPPRVLTALERAGLRAVPTGIEHGTVTAVSQGRPFEITTLRRDVETDGRHAVVAFTDDWAKDAARRDFRLNALYAEPDGRLHDPTGGGVADALAGRVVFVGEARTRIAEDYLRILRFFRFQAWYGRGVPDAEGLAACAGLADGLAGLSAERVAKELLKLLAAPEPLAAVQAMAQAGVLARLPLEAEVSGLARLCAVERALELPADATLRLAALSAGSAEALARRLRLSNAIRDRLVAAAEPIDLEATLAEPQAVRRGVYALGGATLRDRLVLHAAPADAPRLAPAVALAQAWRPPSFSLGGAEIKAAGVAQGPDVGRVRRAVEAWWIAHDFPNDPAALEAELKAAAARLSPR